jgi:AAA15 family ATPase/GTPase
VNKKKIQALTYIPLRPGDLFRLGESKRLFIVNGPPSLMEEEGEVKISSKKKAPPLKKLSKDEMLRRRIEMVKKIHYQRQSNVVEIHHGEGASWGMDDDPEDIDYHSESSDAEYVASLDLEQIKVKDSLTPKQRTFINKIQNLYNKIQVLQKETANIQKKETAATDITDGQKHRIQSIQSRIQEHSAKVIKFPLN